MDGRYEAVAVVKTPVREVMLLLLRWLAGCGYRSGLVMAGGQGVAVHVDWQAEANASDSGTGEASNAC